MKVNYLFVRRVCDECGETYTDTAYPPMIPRLYTEDINALVNRVGTNAHMCRKCRKLSSHITELKGRVIDRCEFNILPKEAPKEESEKSLIPVLFTWVCNSCTYSWDTTESFTSPHTRRTRVPFITADKSCPSCKSRYIALFSEKDL